MEQSKEVDETFEPFHVKFSDWIFASRLNALRGSIAVWMKNDVVVLGYGAAVVAHKSEERFSNDPICSAPRDGLLILT